MVLGKLDFLMQKKKKNEIPYLTLYSKINSKLSKLIKDLNARSEIVKLLEESIEKPFVILTLALTMIS